MTADSRRADTIVDILRRRTREPPDETAYIFLVEGEHEERRARSSCTTARAPPRTATDPGQEGWDNEPSCSTPVPDRVLSDGPPVGAPEVAPLRPFALDQASTRVISARHGAVSWSQSALWAGAEWANGSDSRVWVNRAPNVGYRPCGRRQFQVPQL